MILIFLLSCIDFLQCDLPRVLAHNYYGYTMSQNGNINNFVCVSDSKLIQLIHLVKYLVMQKRTTLDFIIQDKMHADLNVFFHFRVALCSFSFQSSYSSSAHSCLDTVFHSHLQVVGHLPAHSIGKAGKGNVTYSKDLDRNKPPIELSVN